MQSSAEEAAAEAPAPEGQAVLSAGPGTVGTAAADAASVTAAENAQPADAGAAAAPVTAAAESAQPAAPAQETAAPASLARPQEGVDPVSYTVESTVLKASPLIGVAAGQVLSPSEINVSRPEDYTQVLAIRGVRAFSTGLVFCCLTNMLRSCYQGTGRVRIREVGEATRKDRLPLVAELFIRSR